MQDGVNAVTRYFKNNFADGYRQVNLKRERAELLVLLSGRD